MNAPDNHNPPRMPPPADDESPDTPETQSPDPLPLAAAAKTVMRHARKVLAQPLPKAPADVDHDAVRNNAREACKARDPKYHGERLVRYHRERWMAATFGHRTELLELNRACAARADELREFARRARRSLDNAPQTLTVPGDREPWTWFHALLVPALLALSAFFLYLGWKSIGYLVANAGVLPPEQSWIVSSGGILAAVALKLMAGLFEYGRKRAYLKALLIGSIAAWALWVGAFAYVYGRSLFGTTQLGVASPQDDAAATVEFLGIAQLALQLFGEILCSASCVIAVELISEKHAGLRTIVHPDHRRRAKVLARACTLLTRLELVRTRLDARLQQLESAGSRLELAALHAFETRYRQLMTEVVDLFTNSSPPAAAETAELSGAGIP
jgi:hypothetical protein